jgi:HK97 gp10 family phage protein
VAEVKNFRSEILLKAVSQQAQARRQVRQIAAKVRDDARALAPKQTGALRRSIKVFQGRDRLTGQTEYRIGWDRNVALYGWMVEAGTEHSQPQPHLRPAAIKNGGRPPLSGGV